MAYLQSKERELVTDQTQYLLMKQNHEQIRALITLEKYFLRDQAFLEVLVDQKLIPQFTEQLNYSQQPVQQVAKFTGKFFHTLTTFIERERDFIL